MDKGESRMRFLSRVSAKVKLDRHKIHLVILYRSGKVRTCYSYNSYEVRVIDQRHVQNLRVLVNTSVLQRLC